jgi:hypothetical protein
MTKIRITEKQYEVILSYKSLLKEGDDAKTDLKVILAISVLIGLNITGHNKIMADMAFKRQNNIY